MNESEIFIAAVQIEEASIRAAFLESVCSGDLEKLRRIERLITQYGSWQGAWDGFSDKLAERFVESIEGINNDPHPTLHAQLDPTYRSGTRVGAYVVMHRLGAGGMGEVYLAHDERLGRKVALKVLPKRYSHSPQWIQRFEREARAASALNHPNILTIYEIGEADNVHFIASEFIEGRTLQSLAKIELTVSKKLDIALQIAEALQVAHASGVVHRDIKPENVMLRSDGLVKVLDFGIAQYYPQADVGVEDTIAPATTDPGVMIGTTRYMSPEQARREAVDFRADLYSLGVLVFELLTGVLPYPSAKESAILSALLNDEPLQLSQLANSPHSDLEGIIKKLLRNDREERYQSAKEVIVDLRQIRLDFEAYLALLASKNLISKDDERTFAEVNLFQIIESVIPLFKSDILILSILTEGLPTLRSSVCKLRSGLGRL